MRFYTYVWYDPEWIPYYVGKGVGTRCRQRRGIPHPEEGHVVLKTFELEEQAFEHEKQLIAFWGRRELDTDGLLMNLSTGGPGQSGIPPSEKKIKACRRNLAAYNSTEYGRQTTLSNLAKVRAKGVASNAEKSAKSYMLTNPSGESQIVNGLRPFCRRSGLDPSALIRVAKGQASHHKGWKCRYA